MDATADAALERELRERTRFSRLVHVEVATSSQDLAAADAEGGDAVFWADHQTRGRGRLRREWHDEPGLDLAVTFRVHASLPDPVALPAAVPVAALQALEPRVRRRLRLKWPNDVYLDGRKLCGVLIDGAGAAKPGDAETWLVGIGVNVNRTRFPPDLEATATSLALATGRETDRGALLLDLAVRLDATTAALAARDHDALEETFVDRLGLLGRRVVVTAGTEHEGRLESLNFAQLRLDDGRTFPLGAVQSLRPA